MKCTGDRVMDGLDSIVIGTAGHIDHGKTTLVKALTGNDTDVLEEEKRRGITINLGFTYFKLPCGRTAGIVDVPGHERFIKNMLAGSGGIDIAMVVIAANEGVMPQTKEHIHILGFLGVTRAVVVLTKTGMVDDEFRELVLEDTKDYLGKTFLKDAPIVQVDSLSGQGIDELVATLDGMARKVNRRADEKAARMPVDRAFSVKGFGTVITGTLNEGTVAVEDELFVYPEELPVKVRGIQIHEQTVEKAHAGQRTALNLTGVSVEQLHRGSVVAKKGSLSPTEILDVKLTLIDEAERPVKRLDTLRLYLGSKEVSAKILLFGENAVRPGEQCYAQLMTEEPVIARRGDCFVLRTLSPVRTVGGGVIVDPLSARVRKGDTAALQAAREKDAADPLTVLSAFVKKLPFSSKEDLEGAANIASADAALVELFQRGTLLGLEAGIVHRDTLAELRQRARDVLKAYHSEFSLRTGMPKAEIQERMGMTGRSKPFESLLRQLADEKEIALRPAEVCLRGFSPAFSGRLQALRDEILGEVKRCGYTPPELKELVGSDKERKAVLEKLTQDELKILGGQVVIDAALYRKAVDFAVGLAAKQGEISLSSFRDGLGCSRKYALLLLEQFDREKITRRQGENRILLPRAAS